MEQNVQSRQSQNRMSGNASVGCPVGDFLWQGEKTAPYAGDIQIRYHGQGISRQTLEQITEAGLKQEKKTFPETAAWSVEYDVEARNPVLNFKQDVTCIMVRRDGSDCKGPAGGRHLWLWR